MTQRELIDGAARQFRGQFPQYETSPLYYGIAPGRVEILGNHTDYNEGYVLSAAIDKYTVLVGTPVPGNITSLYSESMNSTVEFAIDDESPYPKYSPESWTNYPRGVILQMKPRGGFVAVVSSTVPVGAGVSSSAALELATASFIQAAFPSIASAAISRLDIALLCKKAENDFVGMGCGILDQFTSAFGQEGQLVFLDCRELKQPKFVPLPKEYSFIVVESESSHQLVDGKYNDLRRICFEAAKLLGKPFLRDVSSLELETNRERLSIEQFRVASHIVGENERVLRAVGLIGSCGDILAFGNLLSDSHRSSRYDFQNSCPEIDILIDCAQSLPGFIGARIQGGGFGGSTINLCESSMVEMFRDLIYRAYFQKTGISCSSFVVAPGNGASFGDV